MCDRQAAHAGFMRRLNAAERVLDGHTFRRFQRTVPLSQFLMSARKWLGMRLSERYILRRDNCRKTLFQPALLEDVEYLIPPSAGCNGQWVVDGSGFYRLGRVREQHGLVFNGLKIKDGLARNQLLQLFRTERPIVFTKQFLEAVPVIEGKEFVEVLFIGKAQPFFLSHLAERLHMNRIVVGENTVKIEDQRTNHEGARLTQRDKSMTIRRGMNGEHVRRIQEKLQKLTLYLGPIDSGFGGGTESAVKRFQKARALSVTGVVDAETWSLLFDGAAAPVSEFANAPQPLRCLALTGSFETSTQPPDCFCAVTGDFDGQGISFGVLQWNIGQGSLQPLLEKMFDTHPNVCEDIFQEHGETVRSLAGAPKDDQLEFVRSIQTNGRVQEPWQGMLKTLGRTAEFQTIQSHDASGLYDRATKMCKEYGLTSRRGAALLFDILVQNGSISDPVKAQIFADFKNLPPATPAENEVARMVIIANRRAAAAKPAFVDDVRTRKLAIANGVGTVHGAFYDLADRFCLTLEPF